MILETLLVCGVASVCGLVVGLLVVPFLEAEDVRDRPVGRKEK